MLLPRSKKRKRAKEAELDGEDKPRKSNWLAQQRKQTKLPKLETSKNGDTKTEAPDAEKPLGRKKAKRIEKLQAQKAREANKAADAAKKAFDEAAAAVKGKAKAKEGELSKAATDLIEKMRKGGAGDQRLLAAAAERIAAEPDKELDLFDIFFHLHRVGDQEIKYMALLSAIAVFKDLVPAMTAETKGSAVSRRDLLVQQLLEERRQRLQQKLSAGPVQEEREREETALEHLEPLECSFNSFNSQENLSPKRNVRTFAEKDFRPMEPRDDGFLTSVLARLKAAEAELQPPPVPEPVATGPKAARPRSAPTRAAKARAARGETEKIGTKVSKPSKATPTKAQPKAREPQSAKSEKHSASRRNSSVEGSFQQRLQKWQLQHQASKEKQMQAKQEKEMEELGECTFQPSINSRSEFYARRSRGCFAEALPERLYHEADKRTNLRNKAKEIMEADALCSYTFQPKINENSRGSIGQRAPLHLRIETLNKKREERVRSAQLAQEKSAEHFFQPKISNRSERLVQRKRDMLYRSASHGQVECLRQLGPVEERLYAEAQEKEQRRAALQEFHNEELQSFPSVDDTSRRICKASVYFQGPQQDFLTRQETFELAKQKRMDVRAQHLETECSFQPKITETSRQLVCNNVELLGETLDERIHRLAVRDAERREQLRQDLEELHHKDGPMPLMPCRCRKWERVSNGGWDSGELHAVNDVKVGSGDRFGPCKDYTFKPEINPVSQLLAASRLDSSNGDPHERLYRSGLSKSQRDDSFRSDCSFRPQLDPRSSKRFAHVKSRYAKRPDLMENIRQEQEKKAEYLLERRRELEEERNADCTFTPSVTEGFQDIQRPVAVSGLDRFFELKTLALKKQQEQMEREQKVFRPESVHQGLNVTVPEPFQLSREVVRKCYRIREPSEQEKAQSRSKSVLTLERYELKLLQTYRRLLPDMEVLSQTSNVVTASLQLLPGTSQVGRAQTAQIRSTHQSVSRVHAEVVVEPTQGSLAEVLPLKVSIVDRSSTGHTFVNDQQPGKGNVTKLSAGDVLHFGVEPLRYTLRWRPMLLSISSRFSAEELQSLDEKARKAGLFLTPDWTVQCTHLLLEQFAITPKLLCCIIDGASPVSMAFLSELLKRANESSELSAAALPADFAPKAAIGPDAAYNSELDAYVKAPRPRRELLRGIWVIFSAKAIYDTLSVALSSAGSPVQILTQDQSAASVLQDLKKAAAKAMPQEVWIIPTLPPGLGAVLSKPLSDLRCACRVVGQEALVGAILSGSICGIRETAQLLPKSELAAETFPETQPTHPTQPVEEKASMQVKEDQRPSQPAEAPRAASLRQTLQPLAALSRESPRVEASLQMQSPAMPTQPKIEEKEDKVNLGTVNSSAPSLPRPAQPEVKAEEPAPDLTREVPVHPTNTWLPQLAQKSGRSLVLDGVELPRATWFTTTKRRPETAAAAAPEANGKPNFKRFRKAQRSQDRPFVDFVPWAPAAAMRKVPQVVSPALAELVKAAFDFNYRQRLIGTAIRHANSPEADVRGPLVMGLQEMLESDQRLEAAKEAVLAIGKMAQAMAGKNAKGTRDILRPELLQVLLRLPVGRADAAELSGPTGDLSTADDDVKRGLEEASITLSAKELRKREAELLYEVFVVYLRIMRQRHLHGRDLMGAVLTGLARWGQQVNVELLLEILSELRVVVKDAISRSDEFVALHGLNCALVLLSGPSQALLTDVSWLSDSMNGALSLALPSMFSTHSEGEWPPRHCYYLDEEGKVACSEKDMAEAIDSQSVPALVLRCLRAALKCPQGYSNASDAALASLIERLFSIALVADCHVGLPFLREAALLLRRHQRLHTLLDQDGGIFGLGGVADTTVSLVWHFQGLTCSVSPVLARAAQALPSAIRKKGSVITDQFPIQDSHNWLTVEVRKHWAAMSNAPAPKEKAKKSAKHATFMSELELRSFDVQET
eukprot:s462_g28.t4